MKSGLNYEQAYARLQEIVEKLEGGALTLEESLRLFEEATTLRKQCEQLLDRAESAIRKVTMNQEGGLEEEPFEHDDARS